MRRAFGTGPLSIFSDCPASDPGEAVIAMQLAYCLLRDRQYRLGRSMLRHAIDLLQPLSLTDTMRYLYTEIHEGVAASTPLLNYTRPSGKAVRWSR